MSEGQEAVLDVVAKMRGLVSQGDTLRNTYELLNGLADRIEAAYKRECKLFEEVRQKEYLTHKMELLLAQEQGNVPKLKEAVLALLPVAEHGLNARAHALSCDTSGENSGSRRMIRDLVDDANYALAIAKATLAEPPRNCDRFSNLHDAWLAWQAYCAEHIQDTTTKKFHVWLFDTVTRTRGDSSPRTEQAISCNDAGSKKETK